jgi:uncharacterized membrane protein
MPNWTFLVLHFFHTMALVLWVGGMVALGAVVAPVAFRESPDRTLAGRIVGRSLQRFDPIVVGCIISLAVTSVLMARWFGRWSPWYAVQYACITMMSLSALFSMTVVSPRMRVLRKHLEGTPTEDQRADFHHLHRFANLSMRFNLACGTIAVLLS